MVNIALRSVVAYRMTAGPTPLPLSVALSRVAHLPLGGLLLGALPARFARQTVQSFPRAERNAMRLHAYP